MRVWAFLLYCGLILGPVRPAAAQHPEEPRPLGEALVQLAGTRHLNLIYDPALVAGKEAAPASTDGPAEQVLLRLLRDTGLTFHRLPSGTYVLKREEPLPPLRGSLGGVVLDRETGAPLPGAHVLLAASAGAATDETGLFSFTNLAPGRYRITATYLGYSVATDTVQVLPAGRTEARIALAPQPVPITPLVVEDVQTHPPQDLLYGTLLQPTAAGGLGTPDALRSLGQLMGVRVGDAMADVHVQGGASGEHRFLLDGVPVFEPVHLRGLLGAFNPFAIGRITVHKAGFGAARGSALAGVIAAEHLLESPDGHALDVQLDPMSLNARLHAATPRAGRLQGQVMTAFRTSLWGLYPAHRLLPLGRLLREWNTPDTFLPRATVFALREIDPDLGDFVDGLTDTLAFFPERDPALGFNDLHVAARLRAGPRHQVYTSFYRSWNRLNGNQLSLPYAPQLEAAFADRARPARPADRDDYQWLNVNGQVHYTHLLRPHVLLGARLRGSRYSLTHAYSTLEQGALQVVWTPDGQMIPVRLIQDVRPTDDGNRISEVALEATLDYAHGLHHLQLGAEAAHTDHRFSIEDVYFRPILNAASGGRLALFAEDQVHLGPHTTLLAGARTTLLPQRRQVYAEPRLAVRHERPRGPLGAWSFRAAAGLYRQFINQFSVSSVSPSALLPAIRLWLPVDASVAPPKAYHAAAALQLAPRTGWALRAETYYKHQPHLLSINYPALWTHLRGRADAAATAQADFLRAGRGYAYGTAVALERTAARARFLVRYEHNVARRTRTLLPDAATAGTRAGSVADYLSRKMQAAVPDGPYEPVPWNEPHRLDLALDWMPQAPLTFTARWRGCWGRTWAFRHAYYHYLGTDPDTSPIYGGYDFRRPEAHRLRPLYQFDLGLAYTRALGPTALQLRLDVLNALNWLNEADWSLHAATDEQGEPVYTPVPRSLLPRTPSLALRLRW